MIGGNKGSGGFFVDVKHVKKAAQLTDEQVRKANNRLKWYKKRDEDKIKTDVSKNDFESMIYKMREWLREEENEPYVE